MSGDRGLVVIPTYDEAENIELVLDRVRASVPGFEVLVVDDASPDGTGDLADKVAHLRVFPDEGKEQDQETDSCCRT